MIFHSETRIGFTHSLVWQRTYILRYKEITEVIEQVIKQIMMSLYLTVSAQHYVNVNVFKIKAPLCSLPSSCECLTMCCL